MDNATHNKTPWNPSRTAIARVKNPLPVPDTCPHCGGTVEILSHTEIYGRDYSDWPWQYVCTECRASVGMHPFTHIPLGTLADADTRKARREAKESFHDYLAMTDLSRTEAYAALAEEMGIALPDCHFGWFDVEQCREAQDALVRLIDDSEKEAAS